MTRRYPPRGKQEQYGSGGDIVAALLWCTGLVVVILFTLWTWTPFWDLFVPHFSWLAGK